MIEDTIVAIATPPGRGGIGVVRLSGPRALEIVCHLVRFPRLPLRTQHATLGEFPASGRVLDRVIVTAFRRPHSYTGEDVVEISCHGAPVVLAEVVADCLVRSGESGKVRVAEPGEFTMRAFLNGRIDLTQAEAVRDLIEARTLYQARVAAEQMEGSLARRLKPAKQALVELIAALEAGVDFAEDDLPVLSRDEVARRIEPVAAGLDQLAAGCAWGRVVHDGLTLAIVGRPNVGKSSLFNRLLDEDRAIVTEVPGTTRDLVAETGSVGGIPLRLVDTAGIRDTHDPVEALGVEKSLEAVADSDLRLLVVDTSAGWMEADSALLARMRPLGALVVAANKSDLPPRLSPAELEALLGDGESASDAGAGAKPSLVSVSALTGAGISELKERLLDVALPARDVAFDGALITNLRHQQLLEQGLVALRHAGAGAREGVPDEMLLLDLYDCLRAIDTLTGATTVDDVLGVIFSTFCVGK